MHIKKHITIIFYSVCICLCALFSINANAQAGIARADSLFAQKAFFEATIAYERFLFHHPENEAYYTIKRKKAICYRQLERYEDAVRELSGVNLLAAPDSMKTVILYEKALNHYLLGEYATALFNYAQMPQSSIDSTTQSSAEPLKILIHNQLRNWDEAKNLFIRWNRKILRNDSVAHMYEDTISRLYSADNLPKNYSVRKAKNWSRVIPGAGQIYTGHIGEGAVSFLLSAAALGFGLHQFYFRYWVTGYFVGLGSLHKTYTGGITRAEKLAKIEKHNDMIAFNSRCSQLMDSILRKLR